MKRCFKCLCEKPLEAFYKHDMMTDRRLGKCKECTKKDVTEHRQRNLERIRQYDKMRASMPHRIALRKRVFDEYANKFPDRVKANHAVSNAVRDGRLKRQPCWVCGKKAQAHHPDYSRPLDVVWLCAPHHKAAHMAANDSEQLKKA